MDELTSSGTRDAAGWIQPPISYMALDLNVSAWDVCADDDLLAELAAFDAASDEAMELVDGKDERN